MTTQNEKLTMTTQDEDDNCDHDTTTGALTPPRPGVGAASRAGVGVVATGAGTRGETVVTVLPADTPGGLGSCGWGGGGSCRVMPPLPRDTISYVNPM
jgi:hypothetical protein